MVNGKWLNGKLRNLRSGFISAPRMRKERRLKAFTLVELLVVIAIIGILAAVVMIAINPAEMARKGRDANRFADIENVRKSIDLAVAQGPVFPSSGTRNSVDQSRVCTGGWVGMDLCEYLATLPIDPANQTTPVPFRYEIRSDGTNYEIRVKVESEKNFDKARDDGGDENTCTDGVSGGGAACWYEVGTKLTLL